MHFRNATWRPLFYDYHYILLHSQVSSQEPLIFPQGHCFVSVNPQMFAEGFEERMQCLMDQYRNLDRVCDVYDEQFHLSHNLIAYH